LNKLFSRPPFNLYRSLSLLVSLLVLAVFFFFPPGTILDKTQLIGYAICHQLPSRTIHIDHTPLPLCARCTGIYLGALFGVGGIAFLGRQRAINFPPRPIVFVLVSFIGLMGIDGVNSYLSFFPGTLQLYEPQNWLRLTTGTLYGLAISAITWPVFNQAFWHASCVSQQPIISGFKELFFLLAGAAIVVLTVLWQQPVLLYPVAILSTGGALMMVGLVNMVLILVSTRREGQAHQWREGVVPALMGLAMAVLIIGVMAAWRTMLPQAGDRLISLIF
jgi:uncharacterized membrane protein